MTMSKSETITEKIKLKIFLISVLAIFTSGLSFGLRGAIAGDVQALFLDPIDAANSATMIGQILGVAFLGFSFTLFFGSPLVNVIGIGRMLQLAGASFVAGTLITILGPGLVEGDDIYWALWIGMGLTGVGWGFTESAVNPLTTAIYPKNKTSRLNILHAWWPAGIVVGGVGSLGLNAIELGWQVQFGIILIPTFLFLFLIIGVKFPNTERVESGVKFTDMLTEITRKPSFVIWFFAMFLTAATELAPGQWVDITLSHTIGIPGIVILIYISSLMFFMRHSAGFLSKFMSNTGLLLASCILSAIGLYLLSKSVDPYSAIIASTIWGVGVCFLWPTMLATTSERFPRGGEFFLGLMGSAGSLSIYFVLPMMGSVFDKAKLTTAGGSDAFDALEGAELESVLAEAAQISFQSAVIFPVILVFVFSVVIFYEYRKKHAKTAECFDNNRNG
ncbi:sugar MFS transporter [Vibrio artabrorum]|uniref:MFS transporter n=1 Tax=Vibrio artabrorum TaxID=446374 RepID=UPI00355295F6